MLIVAPTLRKENVLLVEESSNVDETLNCMVTSGSLSKDEEEEKKK